jgi:hypothetical protein
VVAWIVAQQHRHLVCQWSFDTVNHHFPAPMRHHLPLFSLYHSYGPFSTLNQLFIKYLHLSLTMDVAGLVLGVVSVWSTCVEVFELVDSGKKYGLDYELLRVKLEVERIRLLAWGEAVGLSEVENGRPSPDARFNQENVRNTVLRVLGCIQHMFEHTEKLQENYGLRPTTPSPMDQQVNEERPSQSQLILGSIFKRAYENLRRSAKDRQRATPIKHKTLWVVHDKKKFQKMVTEIKGFNDNLTSLFPNAKSKTVQFITSQIEQTEEVQPLQLLQEATEEEHEDISERASVRLEALGATTTARSRISDGARTITRETHSAVEQRDDVSRAVDENGLGEELDELSKQMEELELFIRKKSLGALTLSLIGPFDYSSKVTTIVDWEREQHEDDRWPHWKDELKGFVNVQHASFGQFSQKFRIF